MSTLTDCQALAVVMARVCLVAVEWWLLTTKTTFRFWLVPWDKGFRDVSLKQN